MLLLDNNNWQFTPKAVLAEYNESDAIQRYFVYGNYTDEVLLMNDSASDYYYVHDHLYSPVALTDDTGSVKERYQYNAYGKIELKVSGRLN